MSKKNTRKKRFLVDIKQKLPAYYSEPEGVLTIAYDYEDEETYANKYYIEQIQVAVEQFNKFGFANLVYSPAYNEILFDPNCPIDEMRLRKKYSNKHIFGLLTGFYFTILSGTYFNSPIRNYIKDIRSYLNITPTSLPAFSVIKADTKSSAFQFSAIGILLHEIFHLFGIKDLITLNLNCTNGIYYSNLDKESMRKVKYIKLRRLNSFDCQTIPYKNFTFTPVSLFSLQHYPRKSIHPLFTLNKTRITEILTSYQFTPDLQKDYFDLLASYQGNTHLITYQDFYALAQAIYLIAPDSMMGRTFDVPYYYLIKGMYRPLADEKKLNRLISAFRKAENFNYPILAQEELSVTTFNGTAFSIDLAKKLKIVSLTPESVNCYLKQPKTFKGSLELSKNCILTGYTQMVGNFTLDLVLSNNLTELNRSIEFTIKEKIKPLTTVLLGKRAVVHLLSENSNLDLAALCHAVSLPERNELKCKSFDLPKKLSLANCSVSEINVAETYNFTVTFFNDAANKTCRVQLLSTKDSTLVENLIERNPVIFAGKQFGFNHESNTGYHIRYARYAHEEHVLSVDDTANTVRFLVANNNYLKQCNYLLTIPLFHGVLEGCIDSVALSPLVKTIAKLLPRIGLVSINYLSTLQFPFLFFYSLLESFVANHLKAKNNDCFRYAVNLFLFLLVAELEYGFSNLWELADKPQFFPALADRLNQLFIQMLWAPTVKMTGYLLSVSIMDYCNKPAIQGNSIPVGVGAHSMEREIKYQSSYFFNSLKSAKDTVFSSKIWRMPRLFYSQFSSTTSQQAANDSRAREILQNQVNQC